MEVLARIRNWKICNIFFFSTLDSKRALLSDVFWRICIVFTLHNVFLIVLNKYEQTKILKILLKNEFLSSFSFIKTWFRLVIIIYFYLSLKSSSSNLTPNVFSSSQAQATCWGLSRNIYFALNTYFHIYGSFWGENYF